MESVGFWGRSYAQLRSLPPEVQVAFEWAILQLKRDPGALPASPKTKIRVETEVMVGSLGLRRIKVLRYPADPGFRGIYVLEGRVAVFLRFVFRDPQTYARIDRAARSALAERGTKPPANR